VRVKTKGPGFICAWMVHQNKTTSTYKIFLDTLREACPTWEPKQFVLDFEIALKLAIKSSFPECLISLCYFHLHQSVTKWIKKNIRNGPEFDETADQIHKHVSLLHLAPSRPHFEKQTLIAQQEIKKLSPGFWEYFHTNYVSASARFFFY
jgi:hypothetical protein